MDGEGSYVGHDIHRAARIAGAAHGGQVLLSDAVRALTAATLPADVSLRDLGEHRLKDLRPEPLSQLVIGGLQANFPPLRSLEPVAEQSADAATAFFGRDAELTDVASLLAGRRALLTLTGPGGTGKTRLALQLRQPSPTTIRTASGSWRWSRSATRRLFCGDRPDAGRLPAAG